jgi:hypothetical protein
MATPPILAIATASARPDVVHPTCDRIFGGSLAVCFKDDVRVSKELYGKY